MPNSVYGGNLTFSNKKKYNNHIESLYHSKIEI